MASILWEASSRGTNPVTIMDTDLNSLASAQSNLSAAISNATEMDLYVDLELFVEFAVAPVDGALVNVYIVRQIDGTNYEDATDGASPVRPRNGHVGSFSVRANADDQRMILPMVVLPPGDFKILLVNDTTQAFEASGNTLKGYFYREAVE